MTLLPAMAGLALVAGLAQLCTRHAGAVLGLSMLQGVAVALALAVADWFWAASIVLVLSVVSLPFLFAWVPETHARSMGAAGSAAWPSGWGVAVGAAGAALAVQIPVVGLPFAVLLCGLVAVVTRTEPRSRVLGLLGMQHGITLAACSQGESDGLTILAATLPLVPSVMMASMAWQRRGGGAAS